MVTYGDYMVAQKCKEVCQLSDGGSFPTKPPVEFKQLKGSKVKSGNIPNLASILPVNRLLTTYPKNCRAAKLKI